MELLTRDEKARLQARLEHLLANRPKISDRIAEARALGDLKENAEYHSAREEQGLEEAEIRRLEERLAKSGVVDDAQGKEAGIVFLGATVRLREVGSDEDELIRLVGDSAGVDLNSDLVEATLDSPMGEALTKARVGETVSVRGPRGTKQFEILEIL